MRAGVTARLPFVFIGTGKGTSMEAEVNGGVLLNECATASMLNCSVAFLRKCRLMQRGPAYVKIGRLVRYRAADVEMFISVGRVEPLRGARIN